MQLRGTGKGDDILLTLAKTADVRHALSRLELVIVQDLVAFVIRSFGDRVRNASGYATMKNQKQIR